MSDADDLPTLTRERRDEILAKFTIDNAWLRFVDSASLTEIALLVRGGWVERGLNDTCVRLSPAGEIARAAYIDSDRIRPTAGPADDIREQVALELFGPADAKPRLQYVGSDGCTKLPDIMLDDLKLRDGGYLWFLKGPDAWEAWPESELAELFGEDTGDLVAGEPAPGVPRGSLSVRINGEVRRFRVVPQRIRYGTSAEHAAPQWLLEAWDDDRNAVRPFAMTSIRGWSDGDALYREALRELSARRDARDLARDALFGYEVRKHVVTRYETRRAYLESGSAWSHVSVHETYAEAAEIAYGTSDVNMPRDTQTFVEAVVFHHGEARWEHDGVVLTGEDAFAAWHRRYGNELPLKLTDNQRRGLAYLDAVEKHQSTSRLRQQTHATYVALERRGLVERVFVSTHHSDFHWHITSAGRATLDAKPGR